MSKLSERIQKYKDHTNFSILPKTPLIISINGRNFSNITSLLEKPYDVRLAECFYSTMQRLCVEVEGAIFGYHHNDEIILVIKQDQSIDTNSWLDGRLQKICSIASSIATLHFNACATSVDLNLSSDPMFFAQVFSVPTSIEAINTIICAQQHNFLTSIQFACFYELLKKYDKPTIKDMLSGLTIEEKIDLLQQEANTDFNQYPIDFRRGVGCYKIPQLVNGLVKQKWKINENLPIFTKDQEFLSNILN